MLVRPPIPGAVRFPAGPRRAGNVTPLVIVAFPMLVAAMTLAINSASLHHRQVELQNSAEAAALAGANALVPVDDTLLFTHAADAPVLIPDPIPNTTRDALFANARDAAVYYADQNPVQSLQ